MSNSGKKRLVIYTIVNKFLRTDNFKYKDIRTALALFEVEGYLSLFDLNRVTIA